MGCWQSLCTITLLLEEGGKNYEALILMPGGVLVFWFGSVIPPTPSLKGQNTCEVPLECMSALKAKCLWITNQP